MHQSTVEATLEYQVRSPTHFCFNLEAAHWAGQEVVSEALAVSSGVMPHRFTDEASGNRLFRFDAAPGPLLVSYRAEVRVDSHLATDQLGERPVGAVPDPLLRYLMATRYCESDLMWPVAHELFGQGEPGIARVRRITRWIHEHIRYTPGSTDSSSTALSVFGQRAGVCRDFAHLGITFCRALNIPARLVVGYVWFDAPPQDFHAVFETWLDGHWVMFDATGMAPVDRLIRVGTGSDAKEVAFATFFGEAALVRKVVDVREDDTRGRPSSGEPSLALAATPAHASAQ